LERFFQRRRYFDDPIAEGAIGEEKDWNPQEKDPKDLRRY